MKRIIFPKLKQHVFEKSTLMKLPKIQSCIYLIFLIIVSSSSLVNSQIPSCTSDACNTIEANWNLVNDSLIVCEGETFQVSGAGSTPLNNIESFHWYFIDNSTLQILFDTLLYDTSHVSFTYHHDESLPCTSPVVDLLIDLIVTSPPCGNNMTSCNWKLSSVQIELKPRSLFNVLNTVCLPDLIQFQNSSCFEDSYLWDFGDGTTSTLANPSHTYLVPGVYEVSLTVSNSCGTDIFTQEIEVIQPATADAAVVSGVIDPNSDTLIVCLGVGGDTISLDGSTFSLNESIYLWNALTGTVNYDWIVDPPSQNNPTISDPSIVFFNEGVYSVLLTVNNACGEPDIDTLIFNVISADALQLSAQPDACLSLQYTPSPFNPNASYFINGNATNIFPIDLGIGIYNVSSMLDNECGMQIQTDTFEVTPAEDVSIISPSDTLLCTGSDPILLMFTPGGGTCSGSNLTQVNDSVWSFNPVSTGIFPVTYSKGIGNCADSETLTIEVEGVNVVLTNYDICSWDDSFPLLAIVNGSPSSGGIWSSQECPSCIQADSFIVQNMITAGLDTVLVSYNISSSSGCDGNNSLTVTIHQPLADFVMADTACFEEEVNVIDNSIGSPVLWRINGQTSAPPPFTTLPVGDHNIELVVETPGGCRDSINHDITIVSPPSSFGFTATPIEGCAELEVDITNTSSSTEGLSYEWHLDNVLISTANNPGTILLEQGLTDTTYTLSLSVANGCGGENVSQTITVHPKPIANFGTNQNAYCSGDTVWFGNASHGDPTNVFWDFGNGLTSTAFNPAYAVYFTDTLPAIYSAMLIAYNDCGTDTIVKDILVNPTDVNAFFNTNPTSACVGEAICFESFSTFGAPIIFDFGDGNTTTNPNPCHTYNEPDFYPVSLKAFGCGFDSVFTTVEILPLPSVDILNSPSIHCPGELISFQSNTLNVIDFLWDFGDGSSSSLLNPTHAYANPGSYWAKLIGLSLDGCENVDSVMITVGSPPVAAFSPVTDSICVGTPVTFNNFSLPNNVTCYWDFGDGNSSTDCIPEYTFEAADNFTVTLYVTNNIGCTDTVSQVVNVFAEPIPEFGYLLDKECTPAQLTIINQSSNAQSYLWDFGNGQTSTATNPSVTYFDGNEYTIQLTATNALCSRTTSQSVTIHQTPEPLIVLSDDIGCAPFNVEFEAIVSSNNLSFEWRFGDGTISYDSATSHLYDLPGLYAAKLLVSSPYCVDSATAEVLVHEPVLAEADITNILCSGEATGMIDLEVISGTPNYEYEWSNGSTDANQTNIIAGTYGLTITDNNGCTFSDTFTLSEPPPILLSLVEEGIVSCFGGNDGYLVIEALGGTPGYQFNWNTGNNTNTIDNLPAGTYTVTITDNNNCISINSIELGQNDLIEITPDVIHISCYGLDDGQIFINSIAGGVSPYQITLSGENYEETGSGFTHLEPGDYSAIITDSLGCIQTYNYEIIEPFEVRIDFEEDSLFIRLGETYLLDPTYNAIDPIFDWSPSHGLECADCPYTEASPHHDISYQVVLTDESGCTDIDSIHIQVIIERVVFIPDAFTPNFDGINDVFHIKSGDPSVKRIKNFQVFDRWGEKLFEARDFQPNNPDFGWDGTFNGKPLDPGVYVYYAEVEFVDNAVLIYKGDITLIK